LNEDRDRKLTFNAYIESTVMLAMFVFVIGTYTFIFGSIKLPWKLSAKGWRARIAALFLLAPLPVSIFLGRVVGIGLTPDRASSVFGLTELLLVVLGVGGALLFVYLARPGKDPINMKDE